MAGRLKPASLSHRFRNGLGDTRGPDHQGQGLSRQSASVDVPPPKPRSQEWVRRCESRDRSALLGLGPHWSIASCERLTSPAASARWTRATPTFEPPAGVDSSWLPHGQVNRSTCRAHPVGHLLPAMVVCRRVAAAKYASDPHILRAAFVREPTPRLQTTPGGNERGTYVGPSRNLSTSCRDNSCSVALRTTKCSSHVREAAC
jgi:hypothetical protein